MPQSRLTGTAATLSAAGHSRWQGSAFGACCFAGKLRSPAGPGPVPTVAKALDPYVIPYAQGWRTPGLGT